MFLIITLPIAPLRAEVDQPGATYLTRINQYASAGRSFPDHGNV